MCALEVADVSLSAEFRLDRLASIATGLFAILLAGWLDSVGDNRSRRKQWNHVYGDTPRNSRNGISSEG